MGCSPHPTPGLLLSSALSPPCPEPSQPQVPAPSLQHVALTMSEKALSHSTVALALLSWFPWTMTTMGRDRTWGQRVALSQAWWLPWDCPTAAHEGKAQHIQPHPMGEELVPGGGWRCCWWSR